MKLIRPLFVLIFSLAAVTPSGWNRFVPVPEIRHDTVTVKVIGDVMLHTAQIGAALRQSGDFDFRPFLDSLRPDFDSASLVIANMEFTLAGKPYTGYPAFSAPDAYAQYVRDCGVDVFLTANNHIFDKGAVGIARTFAIYDTLSRVRYTRTNPTMLRVRGINLALINFTYGTNVPQSGSIRVPLMSERQDIADAVAEARSRRADFVLAFPHWGEEYVLTHNARQSEMTDFLVSQGVDAIVGAHPHCVQDSAVIAGVPVYYSIGNAVSNMSAPNTQLELMVTLRFVKGNDFTVKMLEPVHEWLWCSRPGGLNHGYCVIKVTDFIGRRDEWLNPADYDKMVSTWERVSKMYKKL